jgi:hypothetical protein
MKVEITVPESIAEIPLLNYQKFLKVQQNSDDKEFIAQKMIEIFCGIELKDVASIKLTDMNNLVAHFNQIFSAKPVFYQRFKLKEMEFGFIPNLENISWGEYIDLEHHLNSWEDYHKAMAVMYRPITNTYKDKYEIAPYTASEEWHELMKYMPMEIAISARVFFYDLGNALLNSTVDYLETLMIKTKRRKHRRTSQREGNLLSNGDGILAFMQSLKEISQNMTKLQDTDYINVSPISPSRNKKMRLSKENLIKE